MGIAAWIVCALGTLLAYIAVATLMDIRFELRKINNFILNRFSEEREVK